MPLRMHASRLLQSAPMYAGADVRVIPWRSEDNSPDGACSAERFGFHPFKKTEKGAWIVSKRTYFIDTASRSTDALAMSVVRCVWGNENAARFCKILNARHRNIWVCLSVHISACQEWKWCIAKKDKYHLSLDKCMCDSRQLWWLLRIIFSHLV